MASPIQGIRYPIDLQVDKDTDFFKIQVLSYKRKGLTEAETAAVEGVSDILLPMPSNIQDANSVSWGEEKMNSIVAGALTGSYDMMSGTTISDLVSGQAFTQAQKSFETALDISGLNAGNARDLIIKQLAAEAVNVFGGNVSIDQILARQGGKIFNPNLELLFNGVSLRDFRFSFKMTPRDTKERDNVVKIIRTFKKYMAASKNGDGQTKNLYLYTPNVFKLSYMKGNGPHPFLHRFKDCALKGVSVNYTGENVYATYWDGTPISVVMDLNFQELTPIYNEDYDPPATAQSNLGVGW